MSILTWLSQLCNIHIIKVVTICSLPSINILIPDISRIELHIDLTDLFLSVNIILIHIRKPRHTSITVRGNISKRFLHDLFTFLFCCIFDQISWHCFFLLISSPVFQVFCISVIVHFSLSSGYSQSASLRSSTPNNCSAVYQEELALLLIQASPHPLLIAFRNPAGDLLDLVNFSRRIP